MMKLPNDKELKNYIYGDFMKPVSGAYFENISPAVGGVYSYVPDSDDRDVALAVEAARSAFDSWANTPVEIRSRRLMRIADLIEQYLDVLAETETRDTGKPISLSKEVDIPRAAKNFRFFATAILHFASEAHQTDNIAINYTLRQPMGVAGCISPWNLPLYLFTWKIAPAIAAGNCVVAKPSELTPYTAWLLAHICQEAELPPGVLNIIHGKGGTAGEAIVKHKEVKAISFTGGTKTGARIASIAAPAFKKLSLELGGKNPNIIFADCDFEEMMENTLKSSFRNQGQICLCGSRILVERSIYEKFRDVLVYRTRQLKIGDPLAESTDIGAVISEAHMNKILGYIELAKEEGGTILCGGNRYPMDGRCSNGYFVEPTIIEGLSPDCRTNQEEIFGPVVTLIPFDSEEEAIAIANSTPYGLSATLWTNNLRRAHRMAQQLDCGVVWVNCWLLRDLRTPFGGMKQSGVGREGGWEALRFFTEPKNVCIKL